MDWLNYHHLLYFWTVASEGSIARASSRLRVSSPTISAQVAALEDALGAKLFSREGRRLVLTDTGRLVLRYADQIFTLGRELLAAVRDGSTERPLTVVVGVANALPKLIAYHLIEPALRLGTPVRVVCREDDPDTLLAELAIHGVDVVLSDAPATPAARVRAFHHLLGDCGLSFFATRALASSLHGPFPQRLHQAPMLMPRETSSVRGPLERWLEDSAVRPRIVGEFDDSALLSSFGQSSVGVFAAPSAIERAVQRQYGVRVIGRTEEIRERFFMIATERRLTHPAVMAIRDAAREHLFPRTRH